MSSRYTALPNQPPTSRNSSNRELDDTFGSDDEDEHNHDESTRLTRDQSPPIEIISQQTSSIPGAYDFEREYDYDYPPPGSPPQPSARALPNEIGNSNGQIPSSPVLPRFPRPSFFRRAVGVMLPSYYSRLPTEEGPRYRGGGIENDGVFANVAAKPSRPRTVLGENGDVHLVPEDNQKEAPPTYAEAASDSVPPYWETVVHAPAAADGQDTLIDDLPSGTFVMFILNIGVSFFFQFVGFLLTYLLHTSHAAKYGSRAGLGLTLIQFGFYSRSQNQQSDEDNAVPADPIATGPLHYGGFSEPSQTEAWISPGSGAQPTSIIPSPDSLNGGYAPVLDINARDWIVFVFMVAGWFLLLHSLLAFFRVKRWEAAIFRAAHPPPPPTAEEEQQDLLVRQNLRNVFGIGNDESDHNPQPFGDVRVDENGRPIVIPTEIMLEEQRLTRDLRAAGLL